MKQAIKQANCIALTALLLACLSVPASAAPDNAAAAAGQTAQTQTGDDGVVYTDTPVDAFTGTTADGSLDENPAANRVAVSSGTWYDTILRTYVLITDSGEITSNVVDGMVTTEAVSIELGEEAPTYVLYRNGTEVANPLLDNITTPGQYVLKLGNIEDPQAYSLRFTVLNPVSGVLNRFEAPSGFNVVNVTRDGTVFPWSPNHVDLSEEGEYDIGYRCLATNVKYTLNLIVDHTPPTLALEAVTDGKASGPVDLTDLEEGGTITATLNGSPIEVDEKLTQSGSYVLTVTDAAGNSTTYQFQIMIYFNNNSFVFFALVLLMIAALVGYLLFSRTHVRVR